MPVISAGAEVLEAQALGSFQMGAAVSVQAFHVSRCVDNRVCDRYVHICMGLSGSRELQMRIF